jgi:hypothetical protein
MELILPEVRHNRSLTVAAQKRSLNSRDLQSRARKQAVQKPSADELRLVELKG